MADQSHLALLKQGAPAWNAWGQEYYKIQPDLSGANLRRINLSEVNFHASNFSGANFFQTNLCGADLSESNLSEANFREADFTGAKSNGADFSWIVLIGAIVEPEQLNQAKSGNHVIR